MYQRKNCFNKLSIVPLEIENCFGAEHFCIRICFLLYVNRFGHKDFFNSKSERRIAYAYAYTYLHIAKF